MEAGAHGEAQSGNNFVVISGRLAASCSVVLDLLDAVDVDMPGTSTVPTEVTVPGVSTHISARGVEILEAWAELQLPPPPQDQAPGPAPAPVAPFSGCTGEALLTFLITCGGGDPSLAAEAVQAAAFLGCGPFLRLGLELQMLRFALAHEGELPQGCQLSRSAQERVLTQAELELLPSVRSAWSGRGTLAEGGGCASLQPRLLPLETFEALTTGLCGSDCLRQLEPRPEVVRPLLCGLGIKPVLTADREDKDRMFDGKKRYLTLSVPLEVLRDYEVASLELTARARDQGWSSYPEDHNTTRNSWTWGELALHLAEAGPNTALPSRPDGYGRAYTNLHAVDEWQDHLLELGPDAAIVQDLNGLGEGVVGAGVVAGGAVEVQFLIGGVFPGWVHYIRSAGLRLLLQARS